MLKASVVDGKSGCGWLAAGAKPVAEEYNNVAGRVGGNRSLKAMRFVDVLEPECLAKRQGGFKQEGQGALFLDTPPLLRPMRRGKEKSICQFCRPLPPAKAHFFIVRAAEQSFFAHCSHNKIGYLGGEHERDTKPGWVILLANVCKLTVLNGNGRV